MKLNITYHEGIPLPYRWQLSDDTGRVVRIGFAKSRHDANLLARYVMNHGMAREGIKSNRKAIAKQSTTLSAKTMKEIGMKRLASVVSESHTSDGDGTVVVDGGMD